MISGEASPENDLGRTFTINFLHDQSETPRLAARLQRPRRRRTGSAVATDGRRDGVAERTGMEWRRATASTRQRERLSGTAGG